MFLINFYRHIKNNFDALIMTAEKIENISTNNIPLYNDICDPSKTMFNDNIFETSSEMDQ